MFDFLITVFAPVYICLDSTVLNNKWEWPRSSGKKQEWTSRSSNLWADNSLNKSHPSLNGRSQHCQVAAPLSYTTGVFTFGVVLLAQLTINQSSICNSHPADDTELKENTRSNSAAALVGRLRMEEHASNSSALLSKRRVLAYYFHNYHALYSG